MLSVCPSFLVSCSMEVNAFMAAKKKWGLALCVLRLRHRALGHR